MAIQEAVERLKSSLDKEDDGDEDQKGLPPPAQLVTLVELYSSCRSFTYGSTMQTTTYRDTAVPRLKLRRKPASETIQPLLSELEAVVELAGRQASRDDGRALISGTSILAKRVASWVKTSYNVSGDEVMACNVCSSCSASSKAPHTYNQNILKSMMNCTLVSCSHCIHSSIGQRSFERCFPRLTIRSAIEPGWEAGEKSVLDVVVRSLSHSWLLTTHHIYQSAYEALGISTDLLVTVPSTSSLIILAYSKEIDSLEPSRLLSSIFSILLASLQSNFALDESLSILLKTLHRLQITSPNELSPDIIIPLCTILPFVASHHPDPVVRHQAFRILSMLLSSSPAQLRLQVLNELTTDSNSPQMQIAAVSLVKEAVLDAITPSMSTPSVFASPVFLQVFGPTLLRPSPPDLFSSSLSLQEFQDSPEPPRLVECLALYYIILQRDKLNQVKFPFSRSDCRVTSFTDRGSRP